MSTWHKFPVDMLDDMMKPHMNIAGDWISFKNIVLERGIYRCLFKKAQLRASCDRVRLHRLHDNDHYVLIVVHRTY